MSILGSLLSPEHNKRIKSPLKSAAGTSKLRGDLVLVLRKV